MKIVTWTINRKIWRNKFKLISQIEFTQLNIAQKKDLSLKTKIFDIKANMKVKNELRALINGSQDRKVIFTSKQRVRYHKQINDCNSTLIEARWEDQILTLDVKKKENLIN